MKPPEWLRGEVVYRFWDGLVFRVLGPYRWKTGDSYRGAIEPVMEMCRQEDEPFDESRILERRDTVFGRKKSPC